ncbi:MAG: Crp/Fnr family transcriptional regulator [Chromatiales bacterium]|nr:Crp/Fnr family transcriptional regulator [Chromatiales bacterium]
MKASTKAPSGRKRENPTACTGCPVRALALFQGVAERDLDWTSRYREGQYQIAARETLFEEGGRGPLAFTLFSGWVMLSVSLASGKRQILRFVLPGDFLGFQADMSGPHIATATALTDVTVCAFQRDRLASLLRERVDLASRMATLSARDQFLCHQHLIGTGQKSARERIAFLMLELFHRVRIVHDLVPMGVKSDSIALPLSQEQIADAVGLTTVHVNRTLREMRESGLMEIRDHWLIIHDHDGLAAVAHFDPAVLRMPAML